MGMGDMIQGMLPNTVTEQAFEKLPSPIAQDKNETKACMVPGGN